MTSTMRPARAIVMGASAGGLQALQQILPHLPADFSLPVMIVQHRSADNPELLACCLNRCCAVKVRDAGLNERLRPGTVYLAPADYHLLVEDAATLALSIDPPLNYARPAIDILFESAADVFREQLLAVVLTGANSDGCRGARHVKALGGQVVVQDPATAEIPTMPKAVLQTVDADRVLALKDIGPCLAALHGSPP